MDLEEFRQLARNGIEAPEAEVIVVDTREPISEADFEALCVQVSDHMGEAMDAIRVALRHLIDCMQDPIEMSKVAFDSLSAIATSFGRTKLKPFRAPLEPEWPKLVSRRPKATERRPLPRRSFRPVQRRWNRHR